MMMMLTTSKVMVLVMMFIMIMILFVSNITNYHSMFSLQLSHCLLQCISSSHKLASQVKSWTCKSSQVSSESPIQVSSHLSEFQVESEVASVHQSP